MGIAIAPVNGMEIETSSDELARIIMPLVINHLDVKDICSVQSTNKEINETCALNNAYVLSNLSDIAQFKFLSLYAIKNPDKFNENIKFLNQHQNIHVFPEMTDIDKQYKRTLLQIAIMSNNELAKELIKSGIDINKADVFKNTPLHSAVSNNNKELVELLLAAGANCNVTNYNYESPLHTAAYNNYKEIIELLINNGANPYIQNDEGNSPYNLIMTLWRHTDTVKLFD